MADQDEDQPTPDRNRLQEQISWIASIVTPVTVIGALLFYFGYASSRAQYEYFGLDVDAIGLSTQDFVMRSPQPLLVPLLAIGLLGAVAALIHAAIRRHIEASATSTRQL